VSSFNIGGVGRLSQNDYKMLLASCTNVTDDQLVTSLLPKHKTIKNKYIS
jgi:hypothetical protein